jgi:phosphatidylserine/phosphatidylglycerophosphate/cardiolipin synthase-like enzyme
MKSLMPRSTRNRIAAALLVVALTTGVYGSYRELPPEVGMQGQTRMIPDQSVRFLVDETYLDANGVRRSQQQIFDEVLRMIDGARHHVLIDMFLWNPFQGSTRETHRALSQELTDALIAKKRALPEIAIMVISDPINTLYGGQPSYQFDALRAAGIEVVLTEHTWMRDSNPVYSALWRAFLQWPDAWHAALLGEPYTFRWLPNFMNADGESVTLRSYLKLFNFKANHRKLIVADARIDGEQKVVSLVTSANPHDGSSAHSNVALRVEDGIWRDLLASEHAVLAFSGGSVPELPQLEETLERSGELAVSVLTEGAILDRTLELIDATRAGDAIELAMFYLSESTIIDALIAASARDVRVRVVLDPNKDAFGMEKNGIPNRSVAAKLLRDSAGRIELRWCATHGEQCHGKMLLVTRPAAATVMLGSANFTRRNLRNLNLETNVAVESWPPSSAFIDAQAYFERMWSNPEGRQYTLDYAAFRDESRFKALLAWGMERSGLSTF